jgi:TRAP-type C4-dicarboxylate transport system permease small subunit
MRWLTALNGRLCRWALYAAVAALLGIQAVVVWGVVTRYVFNNPQPYVEQIALLLVIVVAMFGASAMVRDAGHIGMETLVAFMPETVQFGISVAICLVMIFFGVLLCTGSMIMASSVWENIIPTLPISEAVRYAPGIIAGGLIVLFSIEHLIALYTNEEVVPSWN